MATDLTVEAKAEAVGTRLAAIEKTIEARLEAIEKTIEARLAAIERAVGDLRRELEARTPSPKGIDHVVGIFNDMPEFEEVIRFMEEARKADYPEYPEEAGS